MRSAGGLSDRYYMALITAHNSRPFLRPLTYRLLKMLVDDNGIVWFRSLNTFSGNRHWHYGIRLNEVYSDHQTFCEVAAIDCYGVRRFPKPDLIIDAGGNIGHFTISIHSHWPEVPKIIFEPAPHNLEVLRQHLFRNDIPASIEASCLGKSDETVPFYLRAANQCSADESDPFSKIEYVQQIRLSDYLSRHRGKRVFIKLDIEGAELSVLTDLASQRFTSVVCVGELHDVKRTASEFEKLMLSHGWKYGFDKSDGNESLFYAISP
jgi:FkbM family methyltransferase